jgi:AcrR family transcriptional regulator
MARQSHHTARGLKTRAALLAAAEKLFGVRGFEETSIAELTKAASIALGTFYLYFPDKRALFIELVDSLGARLRHHLTQHIGDDATDRLEVERRGLEAFLTFVDEHRHLYRIVRQADFVDQRCFRRYYASLASSYARGLRRAMTGGEVRSGDAEVMAYALMGVADFVGMRWVLWSKQRPSAKVIRESIDFIEAALVPDGIRRRSPSRDRSPRAARRPRAAR